MKQLYMLFAIVLMVWFNPVRALGERPDVTISSAPAWASKQSLPALPESLRKPLHYRLVDRQVSDAAGVTAVSHNRFVFTDAAGVQEGSTVRVRFNPAYQQLVFHNVTVWRDGKAVYQLAAQDIKVINAEEDQKNNMYLGLFDALILLQDIRVGDELDYSYSLSGSNPVLGERFTYFDNLGWGVAVDLLSFKLTLPDDKQVAHKVFGNLNTQVQHQQSEGTQTYTVKVENSIAHTVENELPGWFSPFPYIQFTEFNSWLEVQSWASELFKVKTEHSPDLKAYINELKALPKQQAIEQAITFVQDEIRYLGLELGVNSHQPNMPHQVFEKRFGDCKDKTLLLNTLLRALDVDAQPALVSTDKRAYISEYLPTHSAFNHVISHFTLDGEAYWVDPTINYQGSRLSSLHQPDYGSALLVDSQSDALTEVNIKPARHGIDINEMIVAPDYVSPVQWRIESQYYGWQAERLRYQLASSQKKVFQEHSLNYYAQFYPGVQVKTPISFSDNRRDNVITVVESYWVPDFWQPGENGAAEFYLSAGNVSQYVKLPQTVRRKQPLAKAYPLSLSQRVTLLMPVDVDFSALAYQKSFADPYVQIDSAMEYDRRRVTFHARYEALQEFVPVEAVPAHLSKIKQANKYSGFGGTVMEVETNPNYTLFQDFIQQLENKTKMKFVGESL
ncbi:hypothetical protein C3B51_00195 [Pseudoalteromonas rubra]|uniref:Transglutaminase-like domain-containing protein n=1 Tax=Pseudoalteromonas rubra TaxID=43658 RepID=A0A4Q7EN84_9GAMM|nr:DUF3857 domain-containing protein [Pseudoalteromonas rubra]RZM85394.1 hypothetical protein C3B51_00195 [Pseudoalteromonas rubra]